jgi:sarcosine oxidase, subunit gamma
MADASARRSPLHRLAAELAAADQAPERVRLAEHPFLAQLTLRVAPGSGAARAAEDVLGCVLPGAGVAATPGDREVLWLGPDEWLLVGPDGGGDALGDRLRRATEGAHATVLDVSAQRTVVELAGSAARDVLLKGCSLDLHPRAFGTGRCAQTALARTAVILHQRSDEPAFRIFVRSSFAVYLAEWLLDASAEARGVAPLDLRQRARPDLVGAPT